MMMGESEAIQVSMAGDWEGKMCWVRRLEGTNWMSTQQELCVVHSYFNGKDEVQAREFFTIKLNFPTRF